MGDKAGEGALRLTSNKTKQDGFVVTKEPIPSKSGLKLTVDFASYDSSTAKKGAADGISLMLLDGSAPMPKDAGGFGGGLGYQNTVGGYIGVGLDEWGNFATPRFGRGGIPERKDNSITVRGASSVGNPFIATYQAKRKISVPEAKSRKEAARTAKVELSTAGVLTVSIDFHDGQGYKQAIEPVDLTSIKDQPKLPETIRFGFAAGTGDYTNIHELWGAKIESMDPILTTEVSPAGTVSPGRDAEFALTTSNAKDGGPTDGPVTTTQTFPKGVTPTAAKGDGWDCKVEGQKVTCTRPGKDKDALAAGASYPKILVQTKADKGLKPDTKMDVISTVTPGDKDAPETTNEFEVTKFDGPALTTKVEPADKVRAGTNASYTMTTSNAADAGATNGKVEVVRTFPEGVVPVTANGNGWECKIDGQKVACSRAGAGEDALNPGDSYEPVTVGVAVKPGVKGDVKGTTTTSTPKGDNSGKEVEDTTPVEAAAPAEPDLQVNTKPDGEVVKGKPAAFVTTVANGPDGGPTNAEVKVVREFGEGIKPTAAEGDGWKCAVDGQTVTCRRPGTGGDALAADKSYPPIKIKADVAADAAGSIDSWTNGNTKGDDNNNGRVIDTVVVKSAAGQDTNCGEWIKDVKDKSLRAGMRCEG
ncbi:hypothetical protein GCM10010329_20270 [Streptomyces spiroverticillatus]|uniref:DUF11 domain-containing protein n=1 Tax=Streptomyces finlayi TaxID=67296 RepID=A0A918WUA7_9ACTN|nr:hypothetical protein [Streptomyces finlayi]GGZ98645.1 hypothetical protein GCM10010329_20270 [Streptomyces spiroverticillatus]GHC83525.1 hypothetical protein GCM10010334_12710 [Streptomyces finlayi]